jgi:integrase
MATYARYLAAAESGALGRSNVVFINGTIGWVIEKYLAHEHGLFQHHNPAVGIFKLHKQKKITKRWSAEVIEKFNVAATPTVGLFLLLYTAQRESDVVTMQWQHIDWQHVQDRGGGLDSASPCNAHQPQSDTAH